MDTVIYLYPAMEPLSDKRRDNGLAPCVSLASGRWRRYEAGVGEIRGDMAVDQSEPAYTRDASCPTF